MTKPTADVWQPAHKDRNYITIRGIEWASLSMGPFSELNISSSPADMRALVDQIVAGLAKLEKPKGEGA